MTYGSAPTSNEIEVTVIGPGYGECCLVHIGGGNWIVVDSCINNRSGDPAAVSYLENLGIDVSTAIKMLIVTHYHDDHIKGVSGLFDTSISARLCLPAAMDSREFTCRVEAFSGKVLGPTGSVTKEIRSLLEIARRRSKSGGPAIIRAVTQRTILELPSRESGHGLPCTVKCLSPSDSEYESAIENLAKSYAQALESKKRPSATAPNDFSIVLSITIGDASVLLGSDLEHSKDARRGWIAAVASTSDGYSPAAVVKIPHHGGKSGHSEEMWQHLVVDAPVAALTPWQKGGNELPTEADVVRILTRTTTAYCSAGPRRSSSKVYRRSPVVRTIRESGVRIFPAEPETGVIRMRCGASDCADPGNWRVDLYDGAFALASD